MQFQAGLAYMTGPPGRPLRAGASIIDILGAVFGVVATLAALRERDATGRGQRVCRALFESAVFLMGSHMAGLAATGEPPPPMPARRGAWGIYDVFATAAEAASSSSASPATSNGAASARSSGSQAMADDPRLATNALRARRARLADPGAAGEVLAALPQDEVERALRARPASPGRRSAGPRDLFADPHLLAGGGLLQTAISAMGGGETVGLPDLPVEFGAGPRPPRPVAPAAAHGRAHRRGAGRGRFHADEIAALAGAGRSWRWRAGSG